MDATCKVGLEYTADKTEDEKGDIGKKINQLFLVS